MFGLFQTSFLYAQDVEDLEHSTFEVDNLLAKARSAHADKDQYDLAQQSLSISRNLRYDGGIVRASILLGEVCARTNRPEAALQHYLEAEEKLNPGASTNPLVLNKAALLEVYSGLGDLFFQENMYEHAKRYYQNVLALTPDDYPTMEKAADAYLENIQYDSAEIIYKVLIQHYRDKREFPKLVQIYQKLANAYSAFGETGKGLFYYLAIEDIIEYNGYPDERAVMYNNMGKQYAILNDYKKALEYFRKAELQCEYINCDYIEVVYANIGIALHNTGDSKTGVDYLLRALQILKAKKNTTAMASLEHLLAGVYFNNQDVYNALSHNNEAIRIARSTKQNDVLANCYRTGADIYYELYDFEKAYDSYRKYLLLNDSILLKEQGRQQRIDQQRSMLTAAEGQIKYLLTRQSVKDLELQQIRFEQDRLRLLNDNLELEKRSKEDEVLLLQAQKDADQAKLREQAERVLRTNQQLRLKAQQLDAEKQDRVIADLRQKEQIDRAQRQADSVRVVQLRRDQEYQKSKDSSFRRFVYSIGSLGMVILLLLGISWWFARRAGRRLALKNQEIEAQKAQIEEERHKSDRLLLNILPGEIAQELRGRGYATPRMYERSTVLFTDFLNFTRLSESLSPEELIDELNACFLGFDEICEKYGLEKIKTIGDAYMCAGGLPVPNDAHPVDAVNAALEMVDWLKKRHESASESVFNEMRIGIHTGPVIAGVIGKNKFAYDIWGDAVNLASRLEQLGEPGRINISGATYKAVKHRFDCTYRGKKEVHNKGLVDMYFIEQ